ncbi:Hypothetical protein D9617_5g067670 [Elsinoe fawcettii]|nr:Hypothetical protein D9617_5g067670 [Elsinoe fawcettii]
MSETILVTTSAPGTSATPLQKAIHGAQRTTPTFGNFPSYTSTLSKAAVSASPMVSRQRDQLIGARDIGKVKVVVTLEKMTRWGLKSTATAPVVQQEACGLLVFRVEFVEDHDWHLQSVLGDIDFPLGAAIEDVCPTGLRGASHERRVGTEQQFIPEVQGGGASVGGVGGRRTVEMSLYERWAFTTARMPVSSDCGLRRLRWKLEDQRSSRSGVFDRPVHLLAGLAFDDPKPEPFHISLNVNGRLRSRIHRLRRKLYMFGPATSQATTTITPSLGNDLETAHKQELEDYVNHKNRDLPEVIDEQGVASVPIQAT